MADIANFIERLSADNKRLDRLVAQAVRHPHGWTLEQPRWVAVMAIFAVGRTTASALCREFDVDPYETRSALRDAIGKADRAEVQP